MFTYTCMYIRAPPYKGQSSSQQPPLDAHRANSHTEESGKYLQRILLPKVVVTPAGARWRQIRAKDRRRSFGVFHWAIEREEISGPESVSWVGNRAIFALE